MACFAVLLGFPAQSQQDNSALYLAAGADSAREKVLSVQADLIGYFKNNEYFAETVDGYTLFGYQAPVALHYQINGEWSVLGGVYLQKDFGGDGFTEIAPQFSVRYDKGSWFAAFGTLDGSLDHRLIEPLYDFEIRLLDPLENGVQIRYDDRRLFADVWVIWQQVIFPGDDRQEIITGGLSVDYEVVRSDNFSLSFPLQLVLAHEGGQINTANDDPVFTQSNVAIGARLEGYSEGFVTRWGVYPYGVLYGGNIPEGVYPYESGSGIYINAEAESRWLTLMASYWSGSDYISYQGGDLYNAYSRSVVNPAAVDPDRDLLIFRFMKNFVFTDNVRLAARA
ncbi:MAG: hypothetical protein WBH03_06020, partial [Cyclobacteriaceae bacterium]